MRRPGWFSILAAVPGVLLAGGAPSDWPQWRGPDRSAHVAGPSVPASWPEKLTRVWSIDVGPGLSSPVVAGGRAYLLARDGDAEVVTAHALTDGHELWRQTYRSPFFANGGAISPRRFPGSQGRGPFATPTVRAGRVFTLGVDRTLSSFDADTGEPVWRRHYLPVEVPEKVTYVCAPCGCADDDKEFDAPGVCPSCGMGLSPKGLETSARTGGGNYYGAAASPLIVGNLGIVHVGNLDEGVVIAFDRRTGEERWRREGPVVAYSSPVVANIRGRRQVVTMTREAVVGIDLASGELLWSFAIDNNAHSTTPVVLDDLVICAHYQGPTFALRVSRNGKDWSAEQVWENAEQTQWLDSPVLDGDRLYGFFYSHKGRFAALDARTGATLWTSEGRQGEGATVVAAGPWLAGLKSDGTLVVFRKKPTSFEPVRTYSVADSPTWTYPVVLGDRLLIRDERRLTLWKLD